MRQKCLTEGVEYGVNSSQKIANEIQQQRKTSSHEDTQLNYRIASVKKFALFCPKFVLETYMLRSARKKCYNLVFSHKNDLIYIFLRQKCLTEGVKHGVNSSHKNCK